MLIEDTALEGVKILTPRRLGDARGFFSESWNARAMAEAGLDYDFVQDNHSMSAARHAARSAFSGAAACAGQAGALRARAALRRGGRYPRRLSPTYGQWMGVELTFENGKQLLVPEGFLHGFVTREPDTEIIYKCTDFYDA